jgi:hypothetical protein
MKGDKEYHITYVLRCLVISRLVPTQTVCHSAKGWVSLGEHRWMKEPEAPTKPTWQRNRYHENCSRTLGGESGTGELRNKGMGGTRSELEGGGLRG